MDCKQTGRNIDDYLDGWLDPAVQRALEAHLESCAACDARIKDERELRAALRALPVPPMRRGFTDQVFDKVVQASTPRRRSLAPVFGVAMAAGLAVALVVSALLPNQTGPHMHSVQSLTLDQVRTVELSMNSQSELEDVTLTIRVPDGVEIEGFPGQREVSWQTRLDAGVNVLALPLVGRHTTHGELVALLEHADKRKVLTVPLDVKHPDQSGRSNNRIYGQRGPLVATVPPVA
ncbi:MAG: zf-HC2 domain-containing protein [Pseudomonadota bacterium]|nr:MAG: zf-HC2 domain-containing protein [Pseudomonadota bacterium]